MVIGPLWNIRNKERDEIMQEGGRERDIIIVLRRVSKRDRTQ